MIYWTGLFWCCTKCGIIVTTRCRICGATPFNTAHSKECCCHICEPKEVKKSMFNIAKCPYCFSQKVSPGKKLWHCDNCQRDFDQAMVEQEPPKEKKKGGEK